MPNMDPKRPNVVLILSDDQGSWAMGCAGNREIRTPNLDRLAKTGILFRNFFCVSPVCSPARASILTGRIPSRHGIHDWIRAGDCPGKESDGKVIEFLKGQTGYTDILARNGYDCGMSGKWHMGNAVQPQKGFSFWEVHAGGGGPYYNAPLVRDGAVYNEPRYVTDVITDNALRFLDSKTQGSAPFYLSVHYTSPHSPWEREHHPRETWDGYHANCPFDSTPREPMHPMQINSAPYGHDEESRRSILSGYFSAITEMDRNIGRILDRLENAGLRGNTLVLFSSDNGMNMGHHGVYGKGNGTYPMNMYDTSVKVPFIASRPGHVPQGATRDELLSHYDVMPTLLDYLGLDLPADERLPGRSFVPVLKGRDLGHDAPVVVFDEYGPVRMIRDRQWKYVHRYPYGPHEFYDLEKDPDERTDLIDSAAHAGQIARMKAGLEDWFSRFIDPMMDGASEPVTGKGQIRMIEPALRGQKRFSDDLFYLKDGTKPRIPASGK